MTVAAPATTGTVLSNAAGVAVIELDDGSVVEASRQTTVCPTLTAGAKVVAARSGNTWTVLDTTRQVP